jgi:HSP20 family protein
MAEAETRLPVRAEQRGIEPALQAWRPFETLRREMDRLFDDFDGGFWRSPFRSSISAGPFWRREATWGALPAVDITESEKAYEITAELPGMDEKAIEVKVTDGSLTIKGEKQEEKEDYYLHERRFGSFERSFDVPESVDLNKIDASFKKGILTVTLPKKAEAQKASKKIEVKAA